MVGYLPFVISVQNFIVIYKKHKFIICNVRCTIVCTLCTVTADVQLCVPYVQLLQMCNCVYLMYSYCRCAIVCTLCTVTADVQLCVPYVQLLQKCNCVYYVQLLQMCNCVYLMYSYCRSAIVCIMYSYCRYVIMCNLCTLTADV